MSSSTSLNLLDAPQRFDRLRRTRLLSGSAIDRWRDQRVAVIGVGAVGSRLATEIVRTGASAVLIDPEMGGAENLGTQAVQVGLPKVEAVQRACDEIMPGRAEAWQVDVRQIGPGRLLATDLLVDATDDPNLTWPLTLLSNGIDRPLMRVAVDGSGERELGRVAISHGGGGHACAVCSYSPADVSGPRRRQPCPGVIADARPETVSSGAIAVAIAGVALHQAMRLLTGNESELALDHELLLDLTGQQMFSVRLLRSEKCLTGHMVWTLVNLRCSANSTTLVDLFDTIRAELDIEALSLEPFGHALWTTAACDCGTRKSIVGSRWSERPKCPACGGDMHWMHDSLIAQWTKAEAVKLGLGERSLAEIGLPASGAMLVARAADHPPVRLLLTN